MNRMFLTQTAGRCLASSALTLNVSVGVSVAHENGNCLRQASAQRRAIPQRQHTEKPPAVAFIARGEKI